jgi:hypothetical protein
MEYSDEFKSLPIKISGRDYTLKEIDGTQRDAYLNDMASRMKFEDGKPAGIKNFTGLQSKLLSMCLFDPDGKPVPQAVINKWPSSLQAALFDEARKLSGLDKEAGEEAKND